MLDGRGAQDDVSANWQAERLMLGRAIISFKHYS